MKELFHKIKALTRRVMSINNEPHQIALGVSVGAFIGIIPLYGIKTLLVLACIMVLKRINKLAILLGTNVNLPPFTPFITFLGYTIGILFVPARRYLFQKETLHTLSFIDIKEIFIPFFIGSCILGVIVSGIFYFVTLSIISQHRKRRSNKCNPPFFPYTYLENNEK